jgi:flagellar hook protein FlgE
MALSSALFSGISGLNTLGNAMQIIGDNISNVNTIGFKSSNFAFQDVLSQAISISSGTSQVGRGTTMGDINASFEQGSFESTGNTTDLALSGSGFFMVNEPGTENIFYTRAGNFRFDKDGYLVNPSGYIVQGWALDANGGELGSTTDVQMTTLTSPPQESTNIHSIVNLNSAGADNSAGTDASLAGAWDGTAALPLADSAYEYQTTLKLYDSLGDTHDVTVYFDKADTASAYEFIVTSNPSEDLRVIPPGSSWAGLLARGIIDFDIGTGTITDVDLWQINPADGDWLVEQDQDNDLSNGYFTFDPTFVAGVPMSVEVNFGARYDGAAWVNDTLSTTQFASTSTSVFQASDGFGSGSLQGIDVDTDGVITGAYSNGQLLPLYRLSLANFQNLQGLLKEGGNLFRETRDSGAPIINRPGTGGLATVAPNSLEQSNVDIAAEFVKMIVTQRGFQANSKIITVTDQMLAELINLKR